MPVLIVRHLYFSDWDLHNGKLHGPWELVSQDTHHGTDEALYDIMNEIDEIDEATHFYDSGDNSREMFIS